MNLTDALKSDLICLPLTATDKTGVITELLEVFSERNVFSDPEKILSLILEREEIMTTGVGNGVAIPHCKSPMLTEFIIALGIHPEGVDFQSLDNRPANIIFMLIGPENQPGAHIRLLSRISRIISEDKTREQILACQNAKEIYELLSLKERMFLELIS